ncbi:N-6 DNA methylase, partial [Phocaeicola vulgatus]
MRDNIEAIRTAFTLDREGRTPTERERVLLGRYCGFGGLKCILNPARELTDAVHWAKSDLELFAPTVELHRIIRENSRDDMEYKRYTDSLKASVLTAFYTPQTITDTIAEVLHDRKVRPRLVLEPSAGMGAFISPVLSNNLQAEVMAFEKDLLTGKMLGHLYPQQKIRTEGFEKIEKPFLNRFDLAISNIPFGDIAVFDAEYEKKSVMHRIAAKKVHTYFFLKGLDAVRDGGVVAFITSQSVLNTEGNGGTRYLMMKQADLLSAIRLPNNLFTEDANTEVGCDLIILQKNEGKEELSEEDKRLGDVVKSNHTNIVSNGYFLDHPERIIHTDAKRDTDPYGKPAMVYTHSGGVEGIATDLYQMLSADLSARLDLERYNGIKEKRQETRQTIVVQPMQTEAKKEERQATEMEQPSSVRPFYPVENGFEAEGKAQIERVEREMREEEAALTPEERQRRKEEAMMPRPFKGIMEPHLKDGSLVWEHTGGVRFQIGVLRDVTRYGATFQPLDMEGMQAQKAQLYIDLRNTYERLYAQEAERQEANDMLRRHLNTYYDEFTMRYGCLNARQNVKLLMMDASGRNMLALERSEGGTMVKADIFDHPVSFSQETTVMAESPEEALSASLNRYGGVNLPYMESLCDMVRTDMLEALKGRVYYNPLAEGYEIADRFIAGNVVVKAREMEEWVKGHEGDEMMPQAREALEALRENIPEQIPFEDLDFNFGERWIPTGVYAAYMSRLFDTDVKIGYSESLDEYSVACSHRTMKITDEFLVKGYYRHYDGMHLLKHALHNTCPDMMKKVGEDENGNDIKARDSEGIQLANAKIDEIRNGFTEWLEEQSPEFKKRLTDMYNGKFNCFVRPKYDGSHQKFPGLDLKGLGIKDLYPSQKDCVWMVKQNGGGIGDQEVGGGKTLIMCVASYEMKRLG